MFDAYQSLSVRTDASHGQFSHIIVDKYLITHQITKVTADFDRDTAKGAGIGSKVENNLPGIASGLIKCEALSSPAMDRQFAPFKNRLTPVHACFAERGVAVGAPITMMPASLGKYSKEFGRDDAITASFEMGARGDFHEGLILGSPKAPYTGASGTGPEIDNEAFDGGTTFGGGAYLWMLAIVGGTAPTVSIKVQDSSDGGTGDPYADIAVFDPCDLTDPTTLTQFVPIPSTSPVESFTQFIWTATGSPTGFQVCVGMARDYDPGL